MAATIACEPSPPAIARRPRRRSTAPRTSAREVPARHQLDRLDSSRCAPRRRRGSAPPCRPPTSGCRRARGARPRRRRQRDVQSERRAGGQHGEPQARERQRGRHRHARDHREQRGHGEHDGEPEPGDPRRPAPQDPVPGGGQRQREPGEHEQAARELRDQDADRERERRAGEQQGGERGQAAGHGGPPGMSRSSAARGAGARRPPGVMRACLHHPAAARQRARSAAIRS